MADSLKKNGGADSPPDVGIVGSTGRRRLLQAGISIAPVVMTVASRPVLANTNCQTPSGFVSGNVSGPAGATCLGHTPDYWRDNPTLWAPTNPSSLFSAAFTPDIPGHAGLTLLQVVQLSSGVNDVARYVVAALVNNANGSVPATTLPLTTIKDMWTGFTNSGCYSINASVCWSGPEIISYLLSTMS